MQDLEKCESAESCRECLFKRTSAPEDIAPRRNERGRAGVD